MKTSWNDINTADSFLSRTLGPSQSLLVQARLILDPAMRLNVALQKRVRLLVNAYGRKKIREEAAQVLNGLVADPQNGFREKMESIFKTSEA